MTRPARKKKVSSPYGRLTREHALDYLGARAVPLDVATERGYRSVKTRPTLTGLGMSAAPVPGLLIPVMWNKEPVLQQYRPDEPRTVDNQLRKFERPSGIGNRLDCHPRMTPALADASVPLFVTEGVVKGDALASVGVPAVALLGVDNWLTSVDDGGDSKPVADWDDVVLEDRLVVVAFDADCMTKPEVERARQTLTVFLHGRGATVKWLYLPNPKAKTGVDDYLAAGHSVADVWKRVQSPRFKINANTGSLPDRTALALTALNLWNDPPTLFRRGRAVVEVNSSSLGMEDVEDNRFRNRLARAAEWVTPVVLKGKTVGEKKVAPPTDVVGDARVQYEDHRFPQLSRIVTTPVFAGKPHWSLLTEPGYDAATGNLYVPPKGLVVPPVNMQPTRRQAEQAKERLLDYIEDFPFVDDSDKAHALALMLQPFAREIVRGQTPMYVAEAPTEGTGKGLLLDTLLVPGVGGVDGLGPKTSEAEIEKTVTTFFLESRPVIFFDNWPTSKKFASATVASALTMNRYMSRVLGVSRFVNAPNNVVWLLSGNNPQFSPEIRRRVVRIRLDANMPDPKSRPGFRYTLPADAVDNRGEMIHDACTVIAYWLSLGRPGPDDDVVPPIGSFSAWRYVMGGILGAVGVPGFLASLYADATADEEGQSVEAAVFALIHTRVKPDDDPFTSEELLNALPEELAAEVIPGHTKEDSRVRAVGGWLGEHKNRVNGDHKLRQLGRGSGGSRWQLERVQP